MTEKTMNLVKKWLLIWVKAFGVAVVFEILSEIGIPYFIMILIMAMVYFKIRG